MDDHRKEHVPAANEKQVWEKPILFKIGMEESETNINPGPEILILVS